MHSYITGVIGVFPIWPRTLVNMRPFFLTVLILHCFISAANGADIKLLYFYQQGCQWCEKFDETLKDEAVANILAKNTDIIRINVAGSKRMKENIFKVICDLSQEQDNLLTASGGAGTRRCSVSPGIDHSEQDMVADFAIQQTPTLIFVRSAGQELLRIPGFLPKEDFLSLLCGSVPGITAISCNEFSAVGQWVQ